VLDGTVSVANSFLTFNGKLKHINCKVCNYWSS